MIAAAVADGEAAHVIRVELADGFGHDVNFARLYSRGMTGAVWECVFVVGLGFGGPKALSGLGHIPLQIFYQN